MEELAALVTDEDAHWKFRGAYWHQLIEATRNSAGMYYTSHIVEITDNPEKEKRSAVKRRKAAVEASLVP